jgi:hypothetical protein
MPVVVLAVRTLNEDLDLAVSVSTHHDSSVGAAAEWSSRTPCRRSTGVTNLVLLCGHHHRVIHHTPWKIRINADDRKPEFQPPVKPGVDRRWIRFRPRRE